MLRRLLILALLAAACAHAPARNESLVAAAPAPALPPAPVVEPASAAEAPAPPVVAPSEPAPPAPIQSLELRLVKTFTGAVSPKSVALSPDGRWAAVMNLEGMDVWLIDTRTLTVERRIDFGPFKEPAQGWDYDKKKPIPSYAQKPVEAVFTPDSRWLWFSIHNGAAVLAYDLTEQEETPATSSNYRAVVSDTSGRNEVWRLPKVAVGKTPKVVEVTPDGKYLVVANWHTGNISVVDLATRAVVATIQSGASPTFIPRGLAISPDSRTVYVANMGGGTISQIDLETMQKVREDAITPNPRHLVLSRDGKTLFISENGGGQVLKYDLGSQKVIGRTAVGNQTRTIALSHDERVLFAVSNEEGKIVALRADDLSHLFDVPFRAPMGIAVSPDDRRVWVTSYKGDGYVSVYDVVIDGEAPPTAAAEASGGELISAQR